MAEIPPLPSNVFETYRAMVLPAQCDHYGHMNVRYYAYHFDEAGFQLWTVAGVSQAAMRGQGFHMVVARTTTDFVRELTVGASIVVRAGFTRVGSKSISHFARMYNADTGDVAATQETIEVFFDPEARRATAMPAPYRDTISTLVIDADKV